MHTVKLHNCAGLQLIDVYDKSVFVYGVRVTGLRSYYVVLWAENNIMLYLHVTYVHVGICSQYLLDR